MAGTLEVPEEGSSNATQDPKVKAAIKAYNESLNASNKIEDSGLASPNTGAYRTIYASAQTITAAKAAGTYIMASGTNELAIVSGANTGAAISVPFFYFAKADYEVAGKTLKLRVRAQAGTNATKPTMKFTVGLYPISSTGGGPSEFKVTLGTVVSGSTVEFNEPAASTVSQGNSGDLTIPADGAYILGFVTSAETTASTLTKLNGQLQVHSV